MALRVYNTLSRKKETFETLEEGKVSMYVCGPTVYDSAHVGHAMSSLVFDIIRRYLEFSGYEVRHVMNYTDVDDKIIERANHEGVDPIELAERYINQYDQHVKELNILPATVYPRATEEISRIVKMVQELGEAEYAYAVDGDVYFRVERDEDYGKLSGQKTEDMQAGARLEVDDRKESHMDFALWKSAKPGEPSWESPWGKGRPGWHIECSVMSMHHLGEQIDIHGGGNDLVFPHHENEIAQTESLTGKPFARYWMHNGMLRFAGEKMSKSIGNLITISDFLAENEADMLRLMVLSSNYRHPLTFSEDVIAQSKQALERMRAALRPAFSDAKGASAEKLQALKDQKQNTHNAFKEAMEDDFNTASALGSIFDLVRIINQARDAKAIDEELKPAQTEVRDLTSVLGLRLEHREVQSSEVNGFVELLVEIRERLREDKQWELTDLVRDKLAELGIVLEDTKDATSWRWK
ncbi:MAG: cysteine--tRNA ligase [Chloroflexi bacterium]|nr:cysteine--tRNA ligase [Chloroflexota bacterium]